MTFVATVCVCGCVYLCVCMGVCVRVRVCVYVCGGEGGALRPQEGGTLAWRLRGGLTLDPPWPGLPGVHPGLTLDPGLRSGLRPWP